MARPSLKTERTEELLDAFMSTVARFGLDGATLEQISKQANVGRPLLRHYLGNRDEMVVKLLDHVVTKFRGMNDDLSAALPDQNRFQTLISLLFDTPQHASKNAAVFQAMVAASDRHPEMKNQLLAFVFEFESLITREIMREKPNATIDDCKIAATGMTAIYFNSDALRPLAPSPHWLKNQKRAAISLMHAL